LSQHGNLSAVLNIDNYLSNIKARGATRFDAATPLSVYAQDIQQHHQFTHFTQAFITGFGTAGSYLFAMLTQIPKGIFRGAYSLGWQDDITLPIPPCHNNSALEWKERCSELILHTYPLPSTPWRLFNTHPLKDLQAAIDYYTQAWAKSELLLIGFSMGADVMPFMVNRLNANTKHKIRSVNLLNPANTVDFVFHVSGWFSTAGELPYKLYPEMKDWTQWPVNCFYSKTQDSLCETIKANLPQKPDNQQLFYLSGDHHFNGNYQQLIKWILANSKVPVR